ncbi:peptidylprolyl isomerase [Polynucleobacter sp. IMCC30063]|uniref:peptidylprolyl isomerase n=1 Tax=Polynucleobacter sp. IMCC30063 TaxID=2907298 RepID=UPI001F3B6B7A|nr:peptidylprolyl isomerase [Polynucleobacter sp. IMCC30063]
MIVKTYLLPLLYRLAFSTLMAGCGLAFAQNSTKTSPPPGANKVVAASPTPTSKVRNLDGVAAIVNTGYITRKDIDDRVIEIEAQMIKSGKKPPDPVTFRKEVLERLIVEKIMLQEAESTGIIISDKELDAIIGKIAAQNKLTVAEFREKVIQNGMSLKQYRDILRSDVVLARLRDREVEGQIKISDAEVDNYIIERMQVMAAAANSPPAQNQEPIKPGSGPEEIDVAQIFIPVDPSAGLGAQTEARKKAETILKTARGDIDFMKLGAQAAKEDSKIKFQELGYRTPDRLPQIFYESVRNLGSGQVATAVLKSPAGFHILKVLDRRSLSERPPINTTAVTSSESANAEPTAPQNIMVTQTLARHILARPRAGFSDADAERKLNGFREQIKAKTGDFGELAKKFSEDGSAANGGLLGWMGPGDLVPEFEQAMNRLQIGEVSSPVKSQFGWHLIQVVERREAQLTVDKQRQFAKAALRERKIEQAYQDWVRQLRDNATVKLINTDNVAAP